MWFLYDCILWHLNHSGYSHVQWYCTSASDPFCNSIVSTHLLWHILQKRRSGLTADQLATVFPTLCLCLWYPHHNEDSGEINKPDSGIQGFSFLGQAFKVFLQGFCSFWGNNQGQRRALLSLEPWCAWAECRVYFLGLWSCWRHTQGGLRSTRNFWAW